MHTSQKPDVRLVERTGQKPTPVEKSTKVSLHSPAEDQYRTASEHRMGDGNLPTGGCCSRRSPLNRLVGSGAPVIVSRQKRDKENDEFNRDFSKFTTSDSIGDSNRSA